MISRRRVYLIAGILAAVLLVLAFSTPMPADGTHTVHATYWVIMRQWLTERVR